MNKSKLIRILYVLASLLLGVGMVYGLSLAGKETQGPVERIITKATEVVEKVEQSAILEKRETKRADKLEWLAPYRNDKRALTHPDRVLFGAFDNNAVTDFEPLINLEDTLHTTFSIMHIYTAWGSRKENLFPKDRVNSILELGSIPSITWEPWLTAFDGPDYMGLRSFAERDKGGLCDVVDGLYDDYIHQWAREARKVNGPIILRWGHEMNDPYRYPWGPQNNEPQNYVEAYRHVHKIFDQEKARNVLWAWSPHPAYEHFRDYYPGDAMVDYVAVGTLNYGTVANWSRWWTFDDIFGAHYPGLAAFKKSIIISEFGSLAVGGNRGKWFSDALRSIPSKYPLVKIVLFFHFDDDRTTTQQTLNWALMRDKSVVRVLKPEIARLSTPKVQQVPAPVPSPTKPSGVVASGAGGKGNKQ